MESRLFGKFVALNINLEDSQTAKVINYKIT